MLSPGHKANILAKFGMAVPPFPARRLPVRECQLLRGDNAAPEELAADREQAAAVNRWTQTVEAMYSDFVAARASKCLPESERAERIQEPASTVAESSVPCTSDKPNGC